MLTQIARNFKLIPKMWRIFYLKTLGVEIDYSCLISANVDVELGFFQGRKGKIKIASKSRISNGAILNSWGGSIRVDENVFIGPYTTIYGHGGVRIGKDSLIAMQCRILSSEHTIPPKNICIRSQPNILLPVNIGADVWLGAGVTVLGGVTIGDGCVVGAGAVVTKDLPAYSVAVGVPAKIIRNRI